MRQGRRQICTYTAGPEPGPSTDSSAAGGTFDLFATGGTQICTYTAGPEPGPTTDSSAAGSTFDLFATGGTFEAAGVGASLHGWGIINKKCGGGGRDRFLKRN